MNQIESQLAGDDASSRSKVRDLLGLAGWLGLCFTAAATAAAFPVDQWYEELNRPSIAPPNYVFGPVWTLLYILMATSAWMVWREAKGASRNWSLLFFGIQLVLNSAWSWLFFGLHRIDLALGEIVLLLAAILVTTVSFYRIRPWAGVMLVPYLAWVGFASILNFRFWQLNS